MHINILGISSVYYGVACILLHVDTMVIVHTLYRINFGGIRSGVNWGQCIWFRLKETIPYGEFCSGLSRKHYGLSRKHVHVDNNECVPVLRSRRHRFREIWCNVQKSKIFFLRNLIQISWKLENFHPDSWNTCVSTRFQLLLLIAGIYPSHLIHRGRQLQVYDVIRK